MFQSLGPGYPISLYGEYSENLTHVAFLSASLDLYNIYRVGLSVLPKLFAKQDTLVTDPIRIMLGGSAANFAVHMVNLNRGRVRFYEDEGLVAGVKAAAAARGEVDTRTSTKLTDGIGCHLHSSIGNDHMGNFLRNELKDLEVEWSQTREPRHQVRWILN